jgi:hypothetical protein
MSNKIVKDLIKIWVLILGMPLMGCVKIPTPVHDLCTTMPYNIDYTGRQLNCMQTCLPADKLLYLWHIHDSWDDKCL